MATKKLKTIDHIKSGAKYVGSASALAVSIVGIVLFFLPTWKPIATYLTSVLTFVINMALIVIFKKETK